MAAGKAKARKKLTKKQMTQMVKAFSILLDPEQQVECNALFAAQEAIAQLIAENCPIARPTMRPAKKRPVK